MNSRAHGMVASAVSVAPLREARDGVCLTSTVTPEGLVHDSDERAANLAGVLDAYAASGCFHMNVNIPNPSTLRLRPRSVA